MGRILNSGSFKSEFPVNPNVPGGGDRMLLSCPRSTVILRERGREEKERKKERKKKRKGSLILELITSPRD